MIHFKVSWLIYWLEVINYRPSSIKVIQKLLAGPDISFSPLPTSLTLKSLGLITKQFIKAARPIWRQKSRLIVLIVLTIASLLMCMNYSGIELQGVCWRSWYLALLLGEYIKIVHLYCLACFSLLVISSVKTQYYLKSYSKWRKGLCHVIY